MNECPRCDGCGQLADTEIHEPWTAWTPWLSLPMSRSMELMMGMVSPVDCPVCGGSGKVEQGVRR